MLRKSVKPILKKKNIKIKEENLDFNNPSFSFIPKGRHSYRQEGPFLVCRTCELKHSIFIGMEKIMVGEQEDGTPILQKR